MKDFTPDKVKVKKEALTEIFRMRAETLFNWNHRINFNTDCIHIGHVNIRSLRMHIADLKADWTTQNLAAICITETYPKTHSMTYQIPGYQGLHKATTHDIAIYVQDKSKEANSFL